MCTLQRNFSTMMAPMAAAFVIHKGAGLVVECGGRRKTVERMVTTLQRNRHDVRSVRGTLRRLGNEARPTQIQILQQLLDDQDWQLALPMYKSLTEKDWYRWSPTLHARLVALLDFSEQLQEAESLVSELPEQLNIRDRLMLQVCLIESYAKYALLDKALATFHGLQSHSLPSMECLGYRALIRAYLCMDLPHQAHLVLTEMKSKELRPCLDDFKALLAAFGRGEHFADMEKVAYEVTENRLRLDQSGFNMMLSAYSQAKRFDSGSVTLRRMKELSIPCSVNTYNAISKSCPSLIAYYESVHELPQSAACLCTSLQLMGIPDGELGAVKELLALGLPPDSVKWDQDVWELDMHDMFLGTASVVLFQWLRQLKVHCVDGVPVPLTIRVVTGWGKHSDVEGRPVLKHKVLELLERMQSPFRIDSHNKGVLMSRGSSLKSWLTADQRAAAT
ncbi:unnamed protein product [Calypogeia fissa]